MLESSLEHVVRDLCMKSATATLRWIQQLEHNSSDMHVSPHPPPPPTIARSSVLGMDPGDVRLCHVDVRGGAAGV